MYNIKKLPVHIGKESRRKKKAKRKKTYTKLHKMNYTRKRRMKEGGPPRKEGAKGVCGRKEEKKRDSETTRPAVAAW